MSALALVLLTFHGPTGVRIDLVGDGAFVTLTAPDGHPVFISPKALAGMRETSAHQGTHPEARCAILVNAGTVYVTETCDQVRRALEGR